MKTTRAIKINKIHKAKCVDVPGKEHTQVKRFAEDLAKGAGGRLLTLERGVLSDGRLKNSTLEINLQVCLWLVQTDPMAHYSGKSL